MHNTSSTGSSWGPRLQPLPAKEHTAGKIQTPKSHVPLCVFPRTVPFWLYFFSFPGAKTLVPLSGLSSAP